LPSGCSSRTSQERSPTTIGIRQDRATGRTRMILHLTGKSV
jgi:hypothetical protein